MAIEIHNEDPNIYTIDNMLTTEQCQHFIDISKSSLRRAMVSGSKSGYISKGRSGSNTWIEHDHDEITMTVAKSIAEQVNIPLENAEKFQIIHYDENQEYRNHYDSWDHDGSEKTLRNMKYGGARMRTALVYLNNVEEGGGTRMSKLNITIEPREGRLLVFDNVYEGTNKKHLLSEHAGTPVIRGEKYAFNLWFRECNRSMLYSDFNPAYYEKLKAEIAVCNTEKYEIKHEPEFFNSNELISIVSYCNFNTNKHPSCWVKLEQIPAILKKLTEYTGVNESHFESANVVLYKEGSKHGPFYDAYDLNTETGKKYTVSRGQRLKTLTFVMSNSIDISFPKLEKEQEYTLKNGDLLYYTNTSEGRNRNLAMKHILENRTQSKTILVNIYIREHASTVTRNNLQTSQENFTTSLNDAYNKFNASSKMPLKVGSLSYRLSKLTNSDISPVINSMKSNTSILNKKLMETDNFVFDEVTPIKLENTINNDVLKCCQDYYKKNIEEDKFILGDRQSKRYKHYDEPVSRFLQYEILPLIEKIVKKKLRPTYTYLSAYVKDSDLPPHTDREDCQYTVSFLIDKQEGASWPIYFHKTTQPVKYKGRYDFTPDIKECESIDCETGGLMMFCGQDHIHFREKLDADYYTIVLLHYREL